MLDFFQRIFRAAFASAHAKKQAGPQATESVKAELPPAPPPVKSPRMIRDKISRLPGVEMPWRVWLPEEPSLGVATVPVRAFTASEARAKAKVALGLKPKNRLPVGTRAVLQEA